MTNLFSLFLFRRHWRRGRQMRTQYRLTSIACNQLSSYISKKCKKDKDTCMKHCKVNKNQKGYLLFFCSIILVSDGQLQSSSFFSFLPLILHLNTIGPRLAWIQLRPFAFWSFHFFHVAICRLKLKSKFHTALPQFDALTNLRCSNSR